MNIGVLQIALSGFCFGFLGIFGKLAFQKGLAVGELLSLRFIVAALVLFLILALVRPRLLKLSFREMIVCAGLGCLGYAVFSTLYFTAIKGVSVAVASLLLYTFPVMVSLGAHFVFKERLTRFQWFAVPITVFGLLVLIGGGNDLSISSTTAVLAGIGSAVCYSIYILASSKLQQKIDPLTSSLYVIFFAAIVLSVLNPPDFERVRNFETNVWLILLGIAIVCTVAPLFLFLSGLQKLGNTQASLLSTIEPVTAAIMGALILNEAISAQTVIGGILVLLGLAVSVAGPILFRPKQTTERPGRKH